MGSQSPATEPTVDDSVFDSEITPQNTIYVRG